MVIIQNGAIYGFFCDKDVPINSVGYYLISNGLEGYNNDGAIVKQLNKITCTLTLK